jgi:putative PIN family toxin of toxin-antitoxin system
VIVAVLDTNVLVSGFPARTGVPSTLLDAWHNGSYHLVVSEPILEELAETWQDPYWRSRFSIEECERAIALLLREAIVTPLTTEVTGIATHPEDDLILATAISGKATYLVTGDRQLQALSDFQGVTILSPRAFLARLVWGDEENPF